MKYNSEMDELRASLESKVENRDAKISEMDELQFTLHVWLISNIILKVKIVVPSRKFA
jgi:hypothetical protein